MVRATKYPYLMLALLDAWEWFDDSLQTLVKNAGFRPLNRSQSLMMLYILMGIQRPTDIARRAHLSRQAIRHIANQLIEREILISTEDPTDRRSVVLSFASKSSDMRGFAADAIRDLEEELRERMGDKPYQHLVSSLEKDWGAPIKSALDLPATSRVAAQMRARSQPIRRRAPRRTARPSS